MPIFDVTHISASQSQDHGYHSQQQVDYSLSPILASQQGCVLSPSLERVDAKNDQAQPERTILGQERQLTTIRKQMAALFYILHGANLSADLIEQIKVLEEGHTEFEE